MYFLTFSGVCTYCFQCFCECAHSFYGHFLRVRRFFFIAAQVCTVFPALPPRIPGSGFRVPGSGWRFLLLEGCHTHSTDVFTNCWRARAALRAE